MAKRFDDIVDAFTQETKKTEVLPIDKIKLDGGTQIRVKINENVVREYSESMEAGDSFPPIVVFFDGADYWLADGFHRIHALGRLKLKNVEAEIRNGLLRDAVMYSIGANAQHGLRRTNHDKRKAVITLLEDDEWTKFSNRKIAKIARVSLDLVNRVRKELEQSERIVQTNKRQFERGGKIYTQNTENIGKSGNDSGYKSPNPIDSRKVSVDLPLHSYMALRDLSKDLNKKIGDLGLEAFSDLIRKYQNRKI